MGALSPSTNGSAVCGVYWESSQLSPDVKDASASLPGDHGGNSTHEFSGPELSRAPVSLLSQVQSHL